MTTPPIEDPPGQPTSPDPRAADAPVGQSSGGRSATFVQDLLASVVVFLVALPLCMGIAIASNVPVAYGLITGIVGGLVVGFLAGSPLQVSGPAAGLAVIIYKLVAEQGLEVLGIAVLLAGIIQTAAGLMKLGRWFRAVSPAVIEGMLAGIGVLIFASQFHVMVDDAPKKTGIGNLITIPEAVVKGLPWPKLADRSVRGAVVEANQEVGAQHAKQIEILEAYESHSRDDQPDESVDLDELAARQREIAASLDTVAATLREGGVFAADGGTRRESAFNAAREATEAAAIALASRENVEPTLLAAEREVLAFERTLKNHAVAAKVGLLTIAIIVVWQVLTSRVGFFKKLKMVPAPLIAIVVATLLAYLLKLPVMYVEVPDNLLAEGHRPTLTTLQKLAWGPTLTAAVVIAIVASAETLLCASAVDQMHTGPRTQYDRELFAQGIGNTICGFLGALPMTGVIVRSAANVQAGGRTRTSAILHGVWLLLMCVFFTQVLQKVPTSALAAILVYTGYRLMGFGKLKRLWQTRRSEVVIFLATVGTIVATDLLTGVLTGFVLAALKLASSLSNLRVKREIDGDREVLRLQGAATFMSLPSLAEALEKTPQGTNVEIDMAALQFIDHSCVELLDSWEKQHTASGGTLKIDWPMVQQTSRTPRNFPATAAGGSEDDVASDHFNR